MDTTISKGDVVIRLGDDKKTRMTVENILDKIVNLVWAEKQGQHNVVCRRALPLFVLEKQSD